MGLFKLLHGHKARAFEGIPGPEPSFPMGNAGEFLDKTRQPWEVCCDFAHEFGGVTLVWMAGQPALILNDPKLIGEVLESNWTNFYKDAPCKALAPVITGRSLFISNYGKGWNKAHSENPFTTLNQEQFLSQQIKPLQMVIRKDLQHFIDRSASSDIDLYRDMQKLSFHAFSQAFWGQTFGDEVFEWFQSLARTGDRRMQCKIPALLNLPPWRPGFYSARSKWYRMFERLVKESRRKPDHDAPDMLNQALSHGPDLSDAVLAEALATNFFGGVFSGSSTINTALYLLAKHPEERGKLIAALDADLGGTEAYDLETLLGCRQLDFVLREAMRYYPAVPLYLRNSVPEREVKLGDHLLPPNTMIFISNYYLHKFSHHWLQAEKFDPSRWDNGVAEENPFASGYFFPYGRGPRACIGQQYGIFYTKLALATVLLNSTVDLNPAQEFKQHFFFGVMMPKGLKAKFQTRAQCPPSGRSDEIPEPA
ncbi:MAG: cytochrome P450 [Rhodopirellula sp.]|nr:cytochrome P450 [Rhodopirellula sp.]